MAPVLGKNTGRRVGVFGGAFDPPHYGHLALARGALAALDLDVVLFIPASRPPHKSVTSASFAQRLAMVRAAVADDEAFLVSDIEAQRHTPSYSVDTLRLLRRQVDPTVRFFLLIGLDAFLDLPMWKEAAVIPELAELVVVRRRGYDFSPAAAITAVFSAYEKDGSGAWVGGNRGRVRFLDLDIPELSSTAVRQDLWGGEDVSAMVPATVVDTIRRRMIYG